MSSATPSSSNKAAPSTSRDKSTASKGSNKQQASRTTVSSPGGKGSKKSAAAAAAALSRTRGVLDYLRLKVPKSTLRQLYLDEQRGPFVCRAIVQQLSLPAQQILIRLQCTGGSFAMAGVQHWLSNGDKVLRQTILPELRQWAIVLDDDADENEQQQPPPKEGGETPNKQAPPPKKTAELSLTPEFRVGFTASLCRMHVSPWQPIAKDQLQAWERISALKQLSSGSNKRKQPHLSTPDPMGAVTPEDLERYTQTVWDSVLHFLVGTESMEPPAAVVHFLLQTGTMK